MSSYYQSDVRGWVKCIQKLTVRGSFFDQPEDPGWGMRSSHQSQCS